MGEYYKTFLQSEGMNTYVDPNGDPFCDFRICLRQFTSTCWYFVFVASGSALMTLQSHDIRLQILIIVRIDRHTRTHTREQLGLDLDCSRITAFADNSTRDVQTAAALLKVCLDEFSGCCGFICRPEMRKPAAKSGTGLRGHACADCRG